MVAAALGTENYLCGRTPLHRALYWGNIHAAARLLEAGAALNVADLKVQPPRIPPQPHHKRFLPYSLVLHSQTTISFERSHPRQ